MKNDKFSKITKIGQNAWAIAFAKGSDTHITLHTKTHVKNDSRATLQLFFPKKTLQKTPNIRRITSFRKLLKLVTMHGL